MRVPGARVSFTQDRNTLVNYGLLFWPSGLRYCGLGPIFCFLLHIISLYLKMSLFLVFTTVTSMIPFYFYYDDVKNTLFSFIFVIGF